MENRCTATPTTSGNSGLVERLASALRAWHEAFATGRSEPLFAARDYSARIVAEVVLADGSGTASQPSWHETPAADLERAIAEFKAALPGWWYSVCECQVSCDASCAPTVQSPDVHLIAQDARFDGGFHADLSQPSSLAEALRTVMQDALVAKQKIAA